MPALQRLPEPGGQLSPAARCSGTESQWSPSRPAHPASLCRPSPQCTATRAVQEEPACSVAAGSPVETEKRYHTHHQGKRGSKVHLRSLKLPFYITRKKHPAQQQSHNRRWLWGFWQARAGFGEDKLDPSSSLQLFSKERPEQSFCCFSHPG